MFSFLDIIMSITKKFIVSYNDIIFLLFSDLFSSQYSNSSSSHPNKFYKGNMKHVGQTFSYPSETNIAAKCFYKPNSSQSPQSMGKKAATMDSGTASTHSNLKDLPTSSCRNSYPRPLPPLPKAPN